MHSSVLILSLKNIPARTWLYIYMCINVQTAYIAAIQHNFAGKVTSKCHRDANCCQNALKMVKCVDSQISTPSSRRDKVGSQWEHRKTHIYMSSANKKKQMFDDVAWDDHQSTIASYGSCPNSWISDDFWMVYNGIFY